MSRLLYKRILKKYVILVETLTLQFSKLRCFYLMQMLFNMTEEYILIFGEAHWEERQKILLENVTLRVGHRRLPVTPMILIQGQLEKNIEFLLKLYLCSVFSPPCLYCDEISDAYS